MFITQIYNKLKVNKEGTLRSYMFVILFVLMVFDYDPAFVGELHLQAE